MKFKKQKPIRVKKPKSRNYLAIHAHNKTSAGPMKDHKKQENKDYCREEEE